MRLAVVNLPSSLAFSCLTSACVNACPVCLDQWKQQQSVKKHKRCHVACAGQEFSMVQRCPQSLWAAILLVTLLQFLASVDAVRRGGHMVFDFKSCGGSRNCLGLDRLERLRQARSPHTTIDDLAGTLDRDEDLGVDTSKNMLVYRCSGLAKAAQGLTAARTAAAAAAALTTEAPGTVFVSDTDLVDKAAIAAAVVDTAWMGNASSLALTLPETSFSTEEGHNHAHVMAALKGTEIVSNWAPSTLDSSLTVAQTFKLHSRPAAVKKIFLDFDGHVTTGSAWNLDYGDPIYTPAYDTDGNNGSWSAGELSDILAIWRAVSEDYAPWDVDVTTEDPGNAYLIANGMRVAIGGTSDTWLGGGAGGIAYVDAFAEGTLDYQPAFVFPLDLGPNDPKAIWEAVSHEAGHTLGLSHDGVVGGDAYYVGQGSWAPIMGVGYYKPITQWSKGEYTNANNKEDDITIISGYLGPVTNILQEHGSSIATATPLVGVSSGGFTVTGRNMGIIRQPTDVDVFSFTAVAGAATIQVSPLSPWGSAPRSNLNMVVKIMNSAGTVLSGGTLSGVGVGPVSLTLSTAGTYYVSIAPSGSGSAATTGYSSYASRGQYEIVVTYTPTSGGTPSPSPTPPSPSPKPPSPSPNPPSPSPKPPSPSPKPPSPSPKPPSPSPNPPSPSPKPPSPSPTPPSPSPKPPSPSPKPPSPSPKPPSPSPQPLPSPSPSPAQFTVAGVAVSKSFNSTTVICSASVTIMSTTTYTLMDGVSVSGTWGSVATTTGWPYTSTAITGSVGTSLGVASFTAAALASATGNGCTFTLASATKTGFLLASAADQGTSTLRW